MSICQGLALRERISPDPSRRPRESEWRGRKLIVARTAPEKAEDWTQLLVACFVPNRPNLGNRPKTGGNSWTDEKIGHLPYAGWGGGFDGSSQVAA